MTEQKPIMTHAKVVDGTLYVLLGDGSWQETESETDWGRFDALTEDDLRRFAEEDGEAEDFDHESPDDQYRVHCPRKPAAAE